jgi:RimJ/RimL family protein N-acetyltransferase
MITLSKLTPRDFDTFKSWIDSEEELVQFAGNFFTYPLTDEQLHNYINDPQRKAFKVILKETDEVIGHVELNLENNNPRLSRLIIGNKNYRGKKIGKQIILKLLEMAFMYYATEFVDVNVYDWNLTAMKCYEKVGFEETPEESYSHEMNFKVWTAINMSITRDRWLKINHYYIHYGHLRNIVDFSSITDEIRDLVNIWEQKLIALSSETITEKGTIRTEATSRLLVT